MSKQIKNKKSTFRFPFDIDRRIFLLLAAIFFIFSIKPVNQLIFPRLSSKHIATKINKSFEHEAQAFYNELDKLKTAEDFDFKNKNSEEFEKLRIKNWSYFITQNDSLIFWSKADKYLEVSKNTNLDSFYSYQNNGEIGVYVKKEKTIDGKTYSILGKFPLYIDFKVSNDLFKSYFTYTANKNNDDFGYRLIPTKNSKSTSKSTVKINEIPRFELEEKNSFIDLADKNFWNFFLAALPFIFFGISIHTFFKVSVKRNPALYFGLLLLTVLTLRGLTYLYGFPDDFSEYLIFNPAVYGSDWLNISLGDVIINACILFWILFFFIMNIQNKVFKLRKKSSQIFFISAYSFALFFFLIWSIDNIRSIVYDGILNFNSTNYSNINAETLIGLGAMLITFMNYVLGVIILNRYFDGYFSKSIVKIFIPLVGIPLGYLFVDPINLNILIISCLWSAILLYFLNLKFFATKFDFNSYKLIYWIIFLSLSCVALIGHFELKKESKKRLDFAKSSVRFENKNTENSLFRMGAKLRKDKTFLNEYNKTKLAEYLNHNFLYSFNGDYISELIIHSRLDTSNGTSFNKIISTVQSIKPIIRLIENVGMEEYQYMDTFSNCSIFIRLKSARSLAEKNKLTKDLEFTKDLENPKYQYAYYINDKLNTQSGITEFPKLLPLNAQKQTGLVRLKNGSGYSDIIAHNKYSKQKKSVIIRKRNEYLYEISTTYAYVFTVIFIIISLYILGNVLARSNLRRKRFINLLGLTLRMRIQFSILFVVLLSLLIIGFFTILILNNDTRKVSLEKVTRASTELKKVLNKKGIDKINIIDSDKANAIRSLSNSINPYLEKHEVGLNIYSNKGKKVFSTASKKISGMLPQLINPKALLNLKNNSKISTLQVQKLGALDYYTIYSNLYNRQGKTIGVLEVANFSSQQLIRKSNSKIVTMLINIYAFVFLISSIFAFYITKRLTNSFSKIVNQFSKINLTEINEPLKWPYSDEIGLLIKEYNRTLVKLENSTAMLAKSERETAWREMAKQIAHEIKNPLTPMSLSLQSLQIAIRRGDPKVPELTQKMTTTVLEQINVLARIASNFSEFATMTDIVARKESLLDILESTTGIYSDSEDAEFLFVLPKKDILVFVDKVKIIRVLTNIIQNALQAIPDDKVGQIMMSVTKQDKNLIDITITDNGTGITDELKSKIFEPNFTTKSSGSGLGLAMCMDIMLKTGGNIYYETELGEGSSFHILLPIYSEDED